MTTLTGSNGLLKFRGRKVARVRNFSLTLNRDALDDTCVGEDDRTFVPGLFAATGSATILMDPADDGGRAMLNSVFDRQGGNDVEFIFDPNNGIEISSSGFLTSASPSVSVGDVQSASVSFQFSGKVSGKF